MQVSNSELLAVSMAFLALLLAIGGAFVGVGPWLPLAILSLGVLIKWLAPGRD
jgi:hypothetical protein